MSRPQFPPDILADIRDFVRRLVILERSAGAGPGGTGAVPTGVISPYWGTSAPPGWLLCDGGSFSAGTYPALAALLGGTTLPNLKGRVVVGINSGDAEFDALAETGGAKTVTIAEANLPTHTHGMNGHNHGGGTISADSHDHDLTDHNHGGGTGVHSHTFSGGVFGTSNTAHTHYVGGAPGEAAAAPQGVGRAGSTADLANAGVGNTSQGSADTTHEHAIDNDFTQTANGGFAGTAHTNLPPYMALSYIIKAA